MKMLKVNREEAGSIFESLRRDYKIIAPLKKIGVGVFSDADLITYDEVNSFEEIEFFKNPYYSAK